MKETKHTKESETKVTRSCQCKKQLSIEEERELRKRLRSQGPSGRHGGSIFT